MAFQRQNFLGLQGKALSRAIAFCSASCFFLFGYDQGVMGSIISTPYFLDALSIAPKDPNTISTIVSIYDIGNMVGCFVAALVGGRLGRKKTIAIGCGIAILGAAIQTCSYSVAQMIVGRIVTGVGNGMNTSTIPTWVAETSGANNRGQLIAAQLSMVAFGSVIAYFMNYGFFHLTGQIVWRFPIAFQIVFVLVTLVLLPFLPESPRFLYAKGSHDEADTVMSALRGLPRDHEALQADRAEILAAIEVEDKAGAFSFKTLINDKSGQKIPQRMVLVALIQVIQEMTGTNIIVNYSSTIFADLGLEQDTSLILGGLVGIAFWLGSLLGIFLIERVGRKKLLISGTIPVLVCYIVYMLMVKDGRPAQLWASFGVTCVLMAAFGWSWLPGAWVLGPELVPVRYRHIGAALNAFCNWTFVFITVKIGPIGLANIGWKLYIVFIVMTFMQLPIVWLFYPETKGLTLEQIDSLFSKQDDSNERAEGMNEVEAKTGFAAHVDRLSCFAPG